MPITTPNANKIWELYTGKSTQITGTGKCYLGFSSTKPNADGSNFTEPDPAIYPSYARIQMNINEAMEWTDIWGAVAEGKVANAKEFTSTECKEEDGWPTFTHFGIFGQEEGGVPLATDFLTDPDGEPDENGIYPAKSLTVAKNHVAVFRVGTLQLKLV